MVFEFLKDFLHLSFELTLLFIAISFLVAFMQKQFPEEKLKNILLGGHSSISAIKGAAIGFLTPFCSCSAIPLLIVLLQAEAPFCAVISYLFAAPLLNPISIILFVNFFGLKTTIVYAILTFFFAVMMGLLVHSLKLEDEIKDLSFNKDNKDYKCKTIKDRAKVALEDCFDVFQKILPHILLGAFIATLVHGFVPQEFLEENLTKKDIYSVPLASIFGLPLHVHPSTMLPVADALASKGVSLGVIISLIISGAGVSLPEITLLNSIFTKKIIAIFVVCVFAIAMLSGYICNLVF